MTDTFQDKASLLLGGVQSLDECFLLCTGFMNAAAVSRWVAERYHGADEEVPHQTIPGEFGAIHFWMLDRRMSAREIIEDLGRRGIIADIRIEGKLVEIYIPTRLTAIARAPRSN